MSNVFKNFFSGLPRGLRLFVLAYALGLLAWIGVWAKHPAVDGALVLAPSLVWKGQVWRLFTYAFLPFSLVDWIVSLFWIATLVSILGRNFSVRGFWTFSLIAALAGAVPIVLIYPKSTFPFASSSAMIFGLLVAWYRLYGRERVLLLGIGEVSVRQVVLLIAVINSLLLFFCNWFLMLAMWCGGAAGWLCLVVMNKLASRHDHQPMPSERIARLEL